MTYLFEIAKTSYADLLKKLHESGIEAVSPENWSRLQSTAQLIDQPEFAILKVREGIFRLRRRLLASQSEFFSAQHYQDILHWARLSHPTYQKWQQTQRDFFDDPLWWSGCFEKVKSLPLTQQANAQAVLERLQQTWMLESRYAHYSTLDLLHVYQSLMPVFSEWLGYAKTELEKHRAKVSPDLLNAYQHYLTWFEEALLAEKATLRACLQGRLALGLRAGNGSWDNVINALYVELQTLDILPQQRKLAKALGYGHLTPEAFVDIRAIIEGDGSQAEKKAFYALDYHRSFESTDNRMYPHYRFDEHGHSYFIPPRLSAEIPLTPPFYAQLPAFLHPLFWGEMVAFAFFQHPHCQFLLAQEAAFLNTPLPLTNIIHDHLLHHPTWQQSAMCLSYLARECQRVEKWLKYKPVIAFLFPSAINLLQTYQQLLEDNAHCWMMKQVTMLKQVMTVKENQLLEASEKATLRKALAQLESLQQAWHFSGDVLSELNNLTLSCHRLCHPGKDEIKSSPDLSVRHQFHQFIAQAVHVFEITQTTSAIDLSALKDQLCVDPALYDSMALRLWLVDSIKAGTLPSELNVRLQAILDQPQFCETTLDRAENRALGELKKRLPEMLTPVAKDPLAVLDENPWNYHAQPLVVHCQAMKDATVALTDPSIILWQEKFSKYALRFLKELQNLPNWEAFVAHRAQTTQILDLLMEISATHFTALHCTLTHLSVAEKKLTSDHWELFKEIYLTVPIQSLTACLAAESTPVIVVNLDAVSYESQKEFAFLKPKSTMPEIANASTSSPIHTL
jgi:hypothetical protein